MSMKTTLLAAGLALAASGFAAAAPQDPARAPIVVELFQSQGCSSCPPANANVNALAARPDVLALSYGVTYWDQLGWKDTFASPQYTARQWDYARSLGNSNVGTPQVVINGRRELVGANRIALDAAIHAEGAVQGPPVSIQGLGVAVGAGAAPTRPATVWLVRYDPGVRQVPVKRGENTGKTLPHRNVVVELTKLGTWSGELASFRAPASADPTLKTAVLVQTGPAGPILAAAKG